MFTDGSAPGEMPWAPHPTFSADVPFLYAVDLFNHRFYWEAHEAWEPMWRAADDGSAIRDLLQSLIQASASVLQLHMGRQTGAAHLISRATNRLRPWSAQGMEQIYGVNFIQTLGAVQAHLSGGPWPIMRLSKQ